MPKKVSQTPEATEARKQLARQKSRAHYEKLKAAGICTHCARVSAIPGKTRCETCTEIVKGYYEKPIARGVCVWCRKNESTRFWYCFDCRTKINAKRVARKLEAACE